MTAESNNTLHDLREYIKSSDGIVIFATTPNGSKDIAMREQLSDEGYGMIPVVTALPGSIPEMLYKPDIKEEDFNSLIDYPGVIAAIKTIALSQKFRKVLEANLPSDIASFYLREGRRSWAVVVANDILLHSKNAQGVWVAKNKPHDESEIYEVLDGILGEIPGQEFREARVYCGAAVYDPISKRGIEGSDRIDIVFRPFSNSEISEYIKSFNMQQLLDVNGSCRWETDLFQDHILMIDGIFRDDPEFEVKHNKLKLLVKGALPGISDLITQGLNFINSYTQGDQKSVGPVNYILKEIDMFKRGYVGTWGFWRPKNRQY